MTGSPSRSGSYTREPSTVTPGSRSLLAPNDGAQASSTVTPASTCRAARSPRESAFIDQPMHHHDTSLRAGSSAKIALRPARLRDVDYRQLTLNDNLNVRVGCRHPVVRPNAG